MVDKKKAPQRIRELMPAGFSRTLVERTGCKQKQTMSDVVLSENPRNKYWTAVLQLAAETNPEAYATWAAANPDKLPAMAA